MENYMPACRRCNHYKRGNSLEAFRRMIEKIPEKLQRDSYIFKVGVDYGFFEVWDRNVNFYFESYEPPKKEVDPMMKFWADKLLSLAVQQPDIVKDALLERLEKEESDV